MHKLLKTIRTTVYLSMLPLCAYTIHSHAGADVSCQPSSTLSNNQYTACDGLPVLSPANDNRVNILLLLSDKNLATLLAPKPTASLWNTEYSSVPFDVNSFTQRVENKSASSGKSTSSAAYSYQEHCNSITTGLSDFTQQVKNDAHISASEKDILIKARSKLLECTAPLSLIRIDPNWSIYTRQYASYLNASIAFYNTNFSTATKIYALLTQVDQPWLKETAQYMLIRSNLNAAYQSGLAEYGDLDVNKINPVLLKDFFNSITQYFELYPNGRYVASTRGLLRRGYWLNNQPDLLRHELAWQINHPQSKFYNLDMQNVAFEIDRHVFQTENLHKKKLEDPFFLTIYDLMQMRKPETKDDTVISWTELNAQKDSFKQQPELFQYLQANHLFFVQNKPQEALNYLPTENPKSISTYLQLSQAFLKGRILDKIEPQPNAQRYWENLLGQAKTAYQRGLFELALYPHYLKQQNLEAFIGTNAKIKQLSLQKSFIEQSANEHSLIKMVESSTANIAQKNLALYTLLNKSLVHQNFNLFNQAYRSLPTNAAQYKGYNSESTMLKNYPPLANFIWKGSVITPPLKCPELKLLGLQLSEKPQDVNLRLCLGEFFRSEQSWQINRLTATEKQHATVQGPIFKRGEVYKDIISTLSKSEIKAYALYRAIQCYAPAGDNECHDQDVAKTVRKRWFDELKRDYPNSTWAKSLKYYW